LGGVFFRQTIPENARVGHEWPLIVGGTITPSQSKRNCRRMQKNYKSAHGSSAEHSRLEPDAGAANDRGGGLAFGGGAAIGADPANAGAAGGGAGGKPRHCRFRAGGTKSGADRS